MTNNLNIAIASDPQEPLMQKHSKKILKNKLKNDVINFDELEQSYKEDVIERISPTWFNLYLFTPDKIQPFFDYTGTGFENYIRSNEWHPGEPKEIFNKLKYLNREKTYNKITQTIGNNWKDKTIVDFGAGFGIHSWLLADLFKEVIAVDVLALDLLIALQMHKRLGVRSNVKFYLGDIVTCFDEIITNHKPDFLMFQIGYGFHHIKSKYEAKALWNELNSESFNLAKSISDKCQIPFFYS
jgi:tRNA/tmRNA/rRNA uracil-C5-methylase (TrmA/RlmC/RlmD family)